MLPSDRRGLDRPVERDRERGPGADPLAQALRRVDPGTGRGPGQEGGPRGARHRCPAGGQRARVDGDGVEHAGRPAGLRRDRQDATGRVPREVDLRRRRDRESRRDRGLVHRRAELEA